MTRLWLTPVTKRSVVFVKNEKRDSCKVIVQNLDIQYTVGLATGVPVQFLSVGSQTTDGIDGFIDEINFMLAESTVPNVLTTS